MNLVLFIVSSFQLLITWKLEFTNAALPSHTKAQNAVQAKKRLLIPKPRSPLPISRSVFGSGALPKEAQNAVQAKKRLLIPKPRSPLPVSRPSGVNPALQRRVLPINRGKPRIPLRKPDGSFYGYHEEPPLQRRIERPTQFFPLTLPYSRANRLDMGELRPEQNPRISKSAHNVMPSPDIAQSRLTDNVKPHYFKRVGHDNSPTNLQSNFKGQILPYQVQSDNSRDVYTPERTGLIQEDKKGPELDGDILDKAHDLSRGLILAKDGRSMTQHYYHGVSASQKDVQQVMDPSLRLNLKLPHGILSRDNTQGRIMQRPYNNDKAGRYYILRDPITQRLKAINRGKNDDFPLTRVPSISKEEVSNVEDLVRIGGAEKAGLKIRPGQQQETKKEGAKTIEKEGKEKPYEDEAANTQEKEKESEAKESQNKAPIELPPKRLPAPVGQSQRFPGEMDTSKISGKGDDGEKSIDKIDKEIKQNNGPKIPPLLKWPLAKQKAKQNDKGKQQNSEKASEKWPKMPYEGLQEQKNGPPKKQPSEGEEEAPEKQPSLKPGESELPPQPEQPGQDAKEGVGPLPTQPVAPSPPEPQNCGVGRPQTPTTPENTNPSPTPIPVVTTCSTGESHETPIPQVERPSSGEGTENRPSSTQAGQTESNPEFDKMSKAVYQVLEEMAFEGGSHMVEIKSSGCDDPPANGDACEASIGSIKFDGEELSKGVVGFNLVVMSYPDLVVKYTVGYKTGLVAEDSQRMARFLMDLKGDNVIFLASKGDSSSTVGQEVFDALTLYGMRSPFMRVPRSSLAFIGCRGDCSGPWVQQVQRKPKEGPSVISLVIGPQDEFVTVGGGGGRVFELTKPKGKAPKDMENGYNAGEDLDNQNKAQQEQEQPAPQQKPNQEPSQQPQENAQPQQENPQPEQQQQPQQPEEQQPQEPQKEQQTQEQSPVPAESNSQPAQQEEEPKQQPQPKQAEEQGNKKPVEENVPKPPSTPVEPPAAEQPLPENTSQGQSQPESNKPQEQKQNQEQQPANEPQQPPQAEQVQPPQVQPEQPQQQPLPEQVSPNQEGQQPAQETEASSCEPSKNKHEPKNSGSPCPGKGESTASPVEAPEEVTHAVTVQETTVGDNTKVKVNEMLKAKGKPPDNGVNESNNAENLGQHEEDADGVAQGGPDKIFPADAIKGKPPPNRTAPEPAKPMQNSQPSNAPNTDKDTGSNTANVNNPPQVVQQGDSSTLYDSFEQNVEPMAGVNDNIHSIEGPPVASLYAANIKSAESRGESSKHFTNQALLHQNYLVKGNAKGFRSQNGRPNEYDLDTEEDRLHTLQKIMPDDHVGMENGRLTLPLRPSGRASADSEFRKIMELKSHKKMHSHSPEILRNSGLQSSKVSLPANSFLEPHVDDMGTEAEADNEPLADTIVNSGPSSDFKEHFKGDNRHMTTEKSSGNILTQTRETSPREPSSIGSPSSNQGKKAMPERAEALLKFFRPDVSSRPIVVSHQDIEAAVREEDNYSDPPPKKPLPILNPTPPNKITAPHQTEQFQNLKIRLPYVGDQGQKVPENSSPKLKQGEKAATGPLFEIQKMVKASQSQSNDKEKNESSNQGKEAKVELNNEKEKSTFKEDQKVTQGIESPMKQNSAEGNQGNLEKEAKGAEESKVESFGKPGPSLKIGNPSTDAGVPGGGGKHVSEGEQIGEVQHQGDGKPDNAPKPQPEVGPAPGESPTNEAVTNNENRPENQSKPSNEGQPVTEALPVGDPKAANEEAPITAAKLKEDASNILAQNMKGEDQGEAKKPEYEAKPDTVASAVSTGEPEDPGKQVEGKLEGAGNGEGQLPVDNEETVKEVSGQQVDKGPKEDQKPPPGMSVEIASNVTITTGKKQEDDSHQDVTINPQEESVGDAVSNSLPTVTPPGSEEITDKESVEGKKGGQEDFSNKLNETSVQLNDNKGEPVESASAGRLTDASSGPSDESISPYNSPTPIKQKLGQDDNKVDNSGSLLTASENVAEPDGGKVGMKTQQQLSQTMEMENEASHNQEISEDAAHNQRKPPGSDFHRLPGDESQPYGMLSKGNPGHGFHKSFLKRQQANLDRLQKIMEGIEMLQKIDPIDSANQLKDNDVMGPRKPFLKLKMSNKAFKPLGSELCPHGTIYKRDWMKGGKKGKNSNKHLIKKDCMPLPHQVHGHSGTANFLDANDAKESIASVKLPHEYQGLPGEQTESNPSEVAYYFGNNDRDKKEGEMLLKTKDSVFADTHSNVYDNGDYLRAAENMLQSDYRMAYKEAKAAFDKSTREAQRRLGDTTKPPGGINTKRHLLKKKPIKKALSDISTERYRRVMPVKKHVKPAKKSGH